MVAQLVKEGDTRAKGGDLYGALMSYGVAIEKMDQHLWAHPDDPNAYHNRVIFYNRQANVLMSLGDIDGAEHAYRHSKKDLKRVIQFNNCKDASRQELALICAAEGDIYAIRDDFDLAATKYQEALDYLDKISRDYMASGPGLPDLRLRLDIQRGIVSFLPRIRLVALAILFAIVLFVAYRLLRENIDFVGPIDMQCVPKNYIGPSIYSNSEGICEGALGLALGGAPLLVTVVFAVLALLRIIPFFREAIDRNLSFIGGLISNHLEPLSEIIEKLYFRGLYSNITDIFYSAVLRVVYFILAVMIAFIYLIRPLIWPITLVLLAVFFISAPRSGRIDWRILVAVAVLWIVSGGLRSLSRRISRLRAARRRYRARRIRRRANAV